jgi:hypothetical protein
MNRFGIWVVRGGRWAQRTREGRMHWSIPRTLAGGTPELLTHSQVSQWNAGHPHTMVRADVRSMLSATARLLPKMVQHRASSCRCHRMLNTSGTDVEPTWVSLKTEQMWGQAGLRPVT